MLGVIATEAILPLGEAATLGRFRVAVVLPAQESAGEGRPRQDPDPVLEAERHVLALDVASHEVVLHLRRYVAGEAEIFALPQATGQAICRVVAAADVQDFALPHE